MGASLRFIFKFILSTLAPPSFAVGVVMSGYYWFAYIIFLCSAAWALFQWYESDWRTKSCNNLSRLRTEAGKEGASDKTITQFKSASRKYLEKDIAICLFVFLVTVASICWAYYEQTQYYAEEERKELSLAYGKIYPRQEPIPENACPSRGRSNDEFRVFLSLNPSFDTIVGIVGEFPRTVVRKTKKDTIFVSIDKNADGSISLSLEIKDAQGITLVRITKGEFDINRHHTFGDRPRQDKSHLKVDDDTGKTVLSLDFFNPLAMRIALNIKELDYWGRFALITKEVCYGTFPGAASSGDPIFQVDL